MCVKASVSVQYMCPSGKQGPPAEGESKQMGWSGARERKEGTFVVYYGDDGQRLKRRRMWIIKQLHGKSVLKYVPTHSFPKTHLWKKKSEENGH